METKKCSKCNLEKHLIDFVKCSKNKSGYAARCKECERVISRNREQDRKYSEDQIKKKRLYYKNYVESKKQSGEWEDSRKIVCKKYRDKNSQRIKEKSAQYKRANKDKVAASTRHRQAKKIMATPAWADLERVKMFYICSRFLSCMWNEPHHVDHIIPLRGKNVSGLHVENNLRIITAKENMRKGNKVINV